MKHNTVKVAALAFAAFATTAAIAACSDSTGPAAPAAISAQSATTITNVPAGASVEAPTVVVTGAGGGPAAGVPVTFTVTAGGGTVANTSILTDASGVASAGRWFLGPIPGVNTVTASVAGLPPVTFTATSTVGAAAQVLPISGGGQVGLPAATLPDPLVARVLDAAGNPLAGQTVTFTVLTGDGHFAGSTTSVATTNAQGNAASGPFTLSSESGDQNIRATSGAGQVTFTVRSHDPCDDRIAITVGDSTTGTLATGDCLMAGSLAKRYAVTTTAGQAIEVTMASTAFPVRLQVQNQSGTREIARAEGGSSQSVKLISAANTKTIHATTTTAGATGAFTLNVDSTARTVNDCAATPFEYFLEIGALTTQNLSTQISACNRVPFHSYQVFIPAGASVRFDVNNNAGTPDLVFLLYAPGTGPDDMPFSSYTGGASIPGGSNAIAFRDVGFSTPLTFTATTSGYYRVLIASYGHAFNDAYGPEHGSYPFVVTGVTGITNMLPASELSAQEILARKKALR